MRDGVRGSLAAANPEVPSPVAPSPDAPPPDAPPVASGDGWRWWHLDRMDPAAAERLAAHGVPPQAIEALLDAAVRPRLIRAPGGLVLILRAEAGDGMDGAGGRDPDERPVAGRTAGGRAGSGTTGGPAGPMARTRDGMLASVRLWVDGSGLVSLARARFPALERCAASLSASPAPGLGTVLTDLIEGVVDGVTPRVEALSAEADALEEGVLAMGGGGPTDPAIADRLTHLRRRVVGLSGKLDAQHEALAALSRLAEREGLPRGVTLDADARLDLSESVEQCRHDAGVVEQLRERALILRDELERRADERTARHGFALSVAAAVFLPATFITGLLGINVGGVPGAGDPEAFWIVAALCAGVAVASVGFLMWRRWL